FAGLHGDGVFLSTNNGGSWTALNSGLTNRSVRSLAVSGTDLYAGTGGGGFLSPHNGTSLTAVNYGFTSADVFALAVSGTNLFAGTYSGGVFLSTNNGTSWTEVDSSLTYPHVASLAVSGTNLFAGTYGGGVFLSTNDGTSWTAVNSGLPRPYVYALAVSGTSLFAGTVGGGVYRRPLSEMITSAPALSERPNMFLLSQNYPNPFNPSTNIKYELPKSSDVKLSVYDMLGREVSVLVNERSEAGFHEVMFDASGLSSGVYLYRLTAGGFVQSRKLLLLR
ncbi:MAG: T9SS type A sorting domain-containing protein, partial [Deltaproteobacteria bacterium]|nr:T9SS type A sorting domain-containing protein [Deltaproteobacteria bacterium]